MTGKEFLEEWSGEGDEIAVHTSGSTGKPKTIRLSKEYMLQSARRTLKHFNIQKGERIHNCVAFDFIGGKMTLVRAIEGGCFLTAETPSNRPTLRGEKVFSPFDGSQTNTSSKSSEEVNQNYPLTEKRIRIVSVVASQMPWLLENRESLPPVDIYLIGGGFIPTHIRNMIIASGVEGWESYGMTETASHIAVRRIEKESDASGYFTPLPGITVAYDDRGCLTIRFDEDDKTEIVTNDIAEILPDGRFRIKGRIDDVIVSGGKKFHPREAERLISAHTKRTFIFGSKPDEKWGERIVLYIEGDAWESVDIINEMKRLTEEYLERWQLPKETIVLAQLPRTANGKLKRPRG